MRSLLEEFEVAHQGQLHGFERSGVLPPSFATPDGREWRLSEIIVGWQPRISDRWAWSTLHVWILAGKVAVRFVPLPCELSSQAPNDPAREFIEREFGPGDRRQPHIQIGEADFATTELLVEFGTITPAKFAINLGTECCDHMVVPFGARYAFVFTPKEKLFRVVRSRPRQKNTRSRS
jgi:hypothetical protein